MGARDMKEKMKLILTQSLSSTIECYMGREQKRVESVIPLPSSFLKSISIMQNIGFSLS